MNKNFGIVGSTGQKYVGVIIGRMEVQYLRIVFLKQNFMLAGDDHHSYLLFLLLVWREALFIEMELYDESWCAALKKVCN